MVIDLRPEHLETVLEILDRRLPGVEVWAFGSRAKGVAKPHSDLDLAIIGDTPLNGILLVNLEEDFSESDLPFRVDVVDWPSADERFRDIIRNEHVVLRPMENPGEQVHA